MAAGIYNFTVEQGATYDQLFTWKDNSSPAVPIDLTGCTAKMQIRPSAGSPTIYITLATGGSGITLGGTAGTIEVVMTATQTAAFNWPAIPGQLLPTAVYDLDITAASGAVTRLLKGVVTLDPGVTQ